MAVLQLLRVPWSIPCTGVCKTNVHSAVVGLKSEVVKKGNLGIDLALFRERLILNADLYKSTTEDMITYVSLPTYYGYEYYASNGGSCQNTGYEFTSGECSISITCGIKQHK